MFSILHLPCCVGACYWFDCLFCAGVCCWFGCFRNKACGYGASGFEPCGGRADFENSATTVSGQLSKAANC